MTADNSQQDQAPPPGTPDGFLPFGSPPSQWKWWYDTATGDRPELFLYTDEVSIAVGEPLALRVHTTLREFDLEIWRDGAERVVVHQAGAIVGRSQATNADPYRNGCGWDVTDTVATDGWASGGYVVRASATLDGVTLTHTHLVIVRPERLSPDRLTLVASTMTWQAYNSWGGSNAYEGIDGPDRLFSPRLSYRRPQQAGTAWLPAGSPRTPTPPPEPGTHTHYPVLDWALAHAYPKYFAAAGWATYEHHMVGWLEREGYVVDIISQHDLHFRPELLATAGPLVFTGHDEYYTREMREHLDAHVDRGGQVARLAGNFIWQVRLDDDGAAQTCWKYRAPTSDPVADDPDRRHLLTFPWDKDIINYPAAATFGASGTRGCYTSLGAMMPRASGGFTIYRPEHWCLAGTDAHYGDLVGAQSRAVCYELDGLDYTFRNGLPYATDQNGIDPDSVEIIGLTPASNLEEDHGIEGSQLYVADGDLAMMALVYADEDTPESREAVQRGCGVLVEYRRGRGRVVTAGSVEWVNGLRLRDGQVEQITRNIVDRLLIECGDSVR